MSTTIQNLEVLPPESAPMHPAPLAEIAAINRFHNAATSAADEARSKAEEASHFALLAGTLLEDLRNSTPHGEWSKLFSDDSPRILTSNPNHGWNFEFGAETARKYIEVAKRLRVSQALTPKAQKHLSNIASAPHIDEDAREFLQALTKGQTLRQLYLDLDIITAPAPKPKADKGDRASKIKLPDTPQLRLEDAREAWFLWREAGQKMVTHGQLDDLDKPGLNEMKEFQAWLRDRINARLK